MPRLSVSRFQQGDLDNLCGAYAVVHAILVASSNRRACRARTRRSLPTFTQEEARRIFAHLIWALVRTSLARPVLDGIATRKLVRLLSVASGWLKKHHGLKIAIGRPFRASLRPRYTSIIGALRDHLECHATSAIIGARPPWDHWTAVSRVGRSRLVIVDSGGWFYVPLRRGKTASRAHAGLIDPSCVFLLTLKYTDARL